MIHRLVTVFLSLCLAGSLPLSAQQPTKEERIAQAKERFEQLKSRLNLTPEQTERLKPVIEQEVTEMRAVRDRLGSDTSRQGRITMFRELKSVQEKYAPQINAILTPEQQKEWKKIKEERKQELREKRGR